MKIHVERIANRWDIGRGRAYCIGHLYVDDTYFCDTLEPYDLGFTESTQIDVIKEKKKTQTAAIPIGEYKVAMHIQSPTFSRQDFYARTCCGYLPRLMNVHGYDGILIHAGNTERDTKGCILVGHNLQVGSVLQSRETFTALYKKMKLAAWDGESITMLITRKYPMKTI